MATTVFDRETLLDVVVNGVPMFIILFFLIAFLVVNPFGFEPLETALVIGLHAVPFISLAVLTYFSAKAISGAEERMEVYPPGRATVPTATPIEHDAGGDRVPATTDEETEPNEEESKPLKSTDDDESA